MNKILRKTDENTNKVMIMKLNVFLSRYFNYLMIIFLILLLLFGFLFFIKPKYELVSNSIKNISKAKEEEYDALEKQYVKISGMWADYNRIDGADVEKIHEMIPQSDSTEELFRELEIIILKSGLTLNSIEISPDNASKETDNSKKTAAAGSIYDNVGRVKINLSVSGVNYEDFKKLLSTFENNLRLMDVQNVNVSLSSGSASFEIITYYLKGKK